METRDLHLVVKDYLSSIGIESAEISSWLDQYSALAKSINISTHVPKFTHSAIPLKIAGIRADFNSGDYVTTSRVDIDVDIVCDAKLGKLAKLFKLKSNDVSFYQYIEKNDSTPLIPFARDEAQLSGWLAGFQLALESGAPGSHKLAKQLYFPIGDDEYHLIAPLFASSLAQILYERIDAERFGEEAKTAREVRKEKVPHDRAVIEFPHLAVQTFGGTKPQNVSLLNSSRRGKAYLFNSQPPHWKTLDKPPADDQAFWRQYSWLVRQKVRELKNYLLSVVDNKGTLLIRDKRADKVAELVAELHQLAARIQSLASGWSRETSLSPVLSCWLDPDRDDAGQPELRARNDWQQGVGEQFALWLNHQLQHEQLQMDDTEHRVWRKIITRELKLLKGDLEVLA